MTNPHVSGFPVLSEDSTHLAACKARSGMMDVDRNEGHRPGHHYRDLHLPAARHSSTESGYSSPPPPLQATFEAVSAEATRVAERATHMAAERHVMATSKEMQSHTDQILTRIAEESGRPLATPVEAPGAPAPP